MPQVTTLPTEPQPLLANDCTVTLATIVVKITLMTIAKVVTVMTKVTIFLNIGQPGPLFVYFPFSHQAESNSDPPNPSRLLYPLDHHHVPNQSDYYLFYYLNWPVCHELTWLTLDTTTAILKTVIKQDAIEASEPKQNQFFPFISSM